ncbi:unnamed protein product, partial [Discosporangium mesarthrocarpum]
MSGLDYSKWDRLAKEISNSDGDSDDGDGETRNKPVVTRFSEPQSVMFGGEVQSEYRRGVTSTEGTPLAMSSALKEPTPAAQKGPVGTTTISKPTASEFSNLTLNGGRVAGEGGSVFVWSQTRGEVMLVVRAPLGTRAPDIAVSLQRKPDTLTEGVADLLSIGIKDGMTLLEGELSFPVKLEDDIDWEVKDYPEREELYRGIVVTLRKHCPLPGVTVWWKSIRKGDPEIDVSRIAGRDMRHKSVWEEAMGMFKEKM